MKIYNYDKETKEFTTQSIATANPLEKGKYLIPANATTKEPIAPKDGFAICFDEVKKEWEYIEDNRGNIYYSTLSPLGDKITVSVLNYDVSALFNENLLETKEDGSCYTYYNQDGTPNLIKEQEVVNAQLKLEADIAKAEALKRLTVTTESGKVFYADTEARIDLHSTIEASNLLGTTETMWKLAEEFEGQKIVLVTLDEIREASNKALEAKGNIVGVV